MAKTVAHRLGSREPAWMPKKGFRTGSGFWLQFIPVAVMRQRSGRKAGRLHLHNDRSVSRFKLSIMFSRVL